MHTFITRTSRVLSAALILSVVMSAFLISGGPAPTVDAAPSGFHDNAWTGVSQSAVSKWVDSWGIQYAVYSVAVEWQGKSTTPLTAPSVGDVFYVHVYTEVYNAWSATYRMRVLMPAGLQLVNPTAANDVYCEISNFSNVEIRLMSECAAPYMSGGYAMFPAVSSGVNERLHFWFPVTATQAMSGTAGDMQVLSDQTNTPFGRVSLPNPTLTSTRLWVVSPSPSAPTAPTGLSAAAGNGSATISFTAGSNGGSAITNYQYSLNAGAWTSLSPADTTSPVTITGLTNGTTYNVQLRAVSTIVGAASASVTVSLPVIALPPIIVIPPIFFPPIVYVPPPYTPPTSTPPPPGGAAGGAAGGASGGGTPPSGGPAQKYTPLVPARVADTRIPNATADGLASGGGPVAAGGTLVVPIAGRGGVPAGAAAVSLNVTIVDPGDSGYATIWPCDQPQPNASNLNYQRGGTIPNSVLTKLAGDGSVCIYTYAAANILIDVNGSFPAGSEYRPLVPARIADTRIPNATIDGVASGGGAAQGGTTLVVPVGGRGGVPAGVPAVSLNVTAVDPRGSGYATVWPCDQPQPNASNLNFVSGRTIPNAVLTKLAGDGTICIFTFMTTDLLVDVNGWFGGVATFNSLVPARIADTRIPNATVDGVASGGGVIPAGGRIVIPVSGRGGVPAGASAVSLNATAVDPGGAGYATVWPCDQPQPNASNLNFERGQTIPNSVLTKLAGDGSVCVFASASMHLLVDVNGAL